MDKMLKISLLAAFAVIFFSCSDAELVNVDDETDAGIGWLAKCVENDAPSYCDDIASGAIGGGSSSSGGGVGTLPSSSSQGGGVVTPSSSSQGGGGNNPPPGDNSTLNCPGETEPSYDSSEMWCICKDGKDIYEKDGQYICCGNWENSCYAGLGNKIDKVTP